jgi:uncharacterized membrane protein HdeD (DUF308 family)
MTTTYAETEAVAIPWWLVLLEGIAAVIIGILLLAAPGSTLFALVQIVGFFWLISGILRIVSIFVDSSLWGWKLVAGILGILAGIVVLQHPLWSTILVPAILIIFLGIEGIIFGGASLVMAFRGGGWGSGVLGVLSIVFGLILLFNPLITVAFLPFVLGAFGVAGGVLAIIAAFMVRKGSPAEAGDTEAREARPV